MAISTPKDNFDRPATLGNYNGIAVPVKVTADGSVCVTGIEALPVDMEKTGTGLTQCRYELTEVIKLDLLKIRDKECYEIGFDAFAVSNLNGSFFMYIGSDDESKKCTINKCLSVGVSAEQVFISNDSKQGTAEIWFFKLKEE